ncbi:MAG: cytochrome c [Thermodesulfovibrionales bacterium]
MKYRYLAAALLSLLGGFLLSSCVQEIQPGALQNVAETAPVSIQLKTDSDSITAGRTLFAQKCSNCHYIDRPDSFVGPSLMGILRNPLLPVSKKPSTPENIVRQMRHPFTNMPSFVFFSDEDLANILAFLNSL